MLKEKILEAVKLLWKACLKLKQSPDLEDLPPEAKEECLFLLLLKTFMESENNASDTNEKADKRQSVDKTEEINEITARKRVVNYLKVRAQLLYSNFITLSFERNYGGFNSAFCLELFGICKRVRGRYTHSRKITFFYHSNRCRGGVCFTRNCLPIWCSWCR